MAAGFGFGANLVAGAGAGGFVPLHVPGPGYFFQSAPE